MDRGAELMEEWFRRPASPFPLTATPNTTTITMDWVLGFARAKTVYDNMISKKMWVTENAKKLIANKLQQQGKLRQVAGPVEFFRKFSDPVPDIDIDHIQEQPVGGQFDPLDGLSAALARFVFRMGVWGTVKWGVVGNTPRHTVEISAVGVYVRDSYDFNDDPNAWFSQPLGCWNGMTNSVSRGACVTNRDFRDWRNASTAAAQANAAGAGNGGDFLVFSDLKITTLSPPEVFIVP